MTGNHNCKYSATCFLYFQYLLSRTRKNYQVYELFSLFQVTTKKINFIVDNSENNTAVDGSEGNSEVKNDEKDRSWLMASLHQMYSRR